MGTWALIQVVVDIFAALGFFVIIMRMSRQPKDDPRLSRGLQLLQSKISVLEDLSDRTEAQVSQMMAILDQKTKEVQAKVQLAEQTVHEIRVSMERSLDVAKIFQDKIPHQEIIERQNTIKYVQAARLAHQGLSAEEIAEKVELPTGELEFIAKVNRDRLMFNEESLPAWAQSQDLGDSASGPMPSDNRQDPHAPQAQAQESAEDQANRMKAEMEIAERQRLVENLSRLQFEMHNLDMQLSRESSVRDMSSAFETPKFETGPMQKLGEEFRKACDEAREKDQRASTLPPLDQLTSLIPQIFHDTLETAARAKAALTSEDGLSSDELATEQREAPRDPETVRALAHAKVQAALAKSKTVPSAAIRAPSIDLAAARAAAKDTARTTSAAPSTSNADVAAKPTSSASGPVVRKVEFPRIDSPPKGV